MINTFTICLMRYIYFSTINVPGIMDNNSGKNLSPEYILREYSGLIKKSIKILAYKYLNRADPFLLDDIEQEVNLRIIRGCLNTYRGEASLGNYISSFVVRSTFLNVITKNSNTHIYSVSDNDEGYDDYSADVVSPVHRKMTMDHSDVITDRITIEKIISEEIKEMSQRQQDIYQMLIVEGKTQVELSEKLEISQSTISEHWSKITQQLRNALLKQIPELKITIGTDYEKSRLN